MVLSRMVMCHAGPSKIVTVHHACCYRPAKFRTRRPTSSTTIMASLFLRSLARSTKAPTPSRLLQRGLATSRTCRLEQKTQDAKTSFDYHTVEDLQGMSAHEILAEPGTREDAKMRHFTGMFNFFLQDSFHFLIYEHIVNFGFVTPSS